MIVGTAGHIDHGKTTLVRALTGVDTDRLPEEKRRGITIDLGFAPLQLPGVGEVGVVDVPGHEAFVRTMVAGATGVDLALVVVAADEGVMPQTREHLAVLELLGVRHAVVALTRRDLVDDDWLALAADDVRTALAGTAFEGAEIVPVSGTSGQGLDALRSALAGIAGRVAPRGNDDIFRLPIDRAFTVRGTGTVVSGTVWSGTLVRDASLRLMPHDRVVRVRGLQAFGRAVDEVRAGDRAAIALAGVDLELAHRGGMLVQGDAWRASRVLRADVTLLAAAPRPLGARARVRLHLGTSDVAARIVVRGGALAPGESRSARIVTAEPVVARAGDRFVLRAESPVATIGGGVVLDPHAGPRARPWPADQRSPSARLALLLGEAGAAGVVSGDLPVRLGVPPVSVGALLAEAGLWRVGDRAVAAATRAALREKVLALVDAHHRAHPLDEGAAPSALRAGMGAPEPVASAAIDELVREGRLAAGQGVLRLAAFVPSLGGAGEALRERTLATLATAGAEPPSIAELATALGVPHDQLLALVHYLARRGELVAVERDRFYLATVLEERVGRLGGLMGQGSWFTAGELREALGMTRKFVIPFLEYCDQRGLTLRDADGRRRWGGATTG